jgi:hypothetical protein
MLFSIKIGNPNNPGSVPCHTIAGVWGPGIGDSPLRDGLPPQIFHSCEKRERGSRPIMKAMRKVLPLYCNVEGKFSFILIEV